MPRFSRFSSFSPVFLRDLGGAAGEALRVARLRGRTVRRAWGHGLLERDE